MTKRAAEELVAISATTQKKKGTKDGEGCPVPSPASTPMTKRTAEELVAISPTTEKNTDTCFYYTGEDDESILPNTSLSNGEIINDGDDYEDVGDDDSDRIRETPFESIIGGGGSSLFIPFGYESLA